MTTPTPSFRLGTLALAGAAFLIPAVAGAQSAGGAVTLAQAAAVTQQDVRTATDELAALRTRIQSEKVPLATELTGVEAEVLRKRREADRIRRVRDNQQFDLNQLEERVKRDRDTNSFLNSLLQDYVRRFESQVHISELQRFRDGIERAKVAVSEDGLSMTQRLEAQLVVVDAALDRLEGLVGGYRFEGDGAVGGVVERGTFAMVGPIAYFSSTAGAGFAQQEANRTQAQIVILPEQFGEGIRSLATTGTGAIGFDPTLGDAEKVRLTEETLLEHIAKGGMVMYPIIGLGLLAMLIFLFKLYEIGTVKAAKPADIEAILDLLRKGDEAGAKARAAKVGGPAGAMIAAAVENFSSDREILEEVLYERIIVTQPKLERFLPFIAITAATAPLLGLLGTVTGMIKTFKLITVFGTGDARQLSGGISEALITTEYGLIVAIPCLILHAILSRMSKGVINSMEQSAVTLINNITEMRSSSDR